MNHKSKCDYVYEDFIQFQNLVKLTFDSEKSRMIFRIIGLYLGMLNSIANPILYAFWYPDFQKYFLSFFSWCKIKVSIILSKLQ